MAATPRYKSYTIALLAGLCVASTGCSTPTRTAHRLYGCWENGASRLVISQSGLYGLSHEGHHFMGTYGLPSTTQLLLQAEGSRYTHRSLWNITVPDETMFESVSPDKKSLQWKRKSLPTLDPKLVGIWKGKASVEHQDFLEITAESGFIRSHWVKKNKKDRRIVSTGFLTANKGSFSINTGGSKSLDLAYTLSDDTLKLGTGKRERVYSKAQNLEGLVFNTP